MLDQQKEVFRLAAVLYAENNYEVTPRTIHRKIIESVFLDNSNNQISVHDIINTIEEDYGFIFDIEEVNEIVLKDIDVFFLLGKNKANELMVSLASKRLSAIKAKLTTNNIDFFIIQFLESNKELVGSLDGKGIIYKFLYEIFQNNISSFSKLIDYKKDLVGAINIDETFNSVEKTIINAFLQWENDGKNKAIFDISSYALEYCLVTNKESKSTFHLSNLKKKDFYLDTNVLFRAIGINGDNRKDRTTTFLNKFLEAGEQLIISKFTEQEYKSTIKYYVEQISKRVYTRIDPRVFVKYKKESDFFDYYHKWRINRTNDSIVYFEAHLMAEYEALKIKFKISEDYNVGFNEKEEKIEKELNELAQDIYSFKNKDNMYYGRFETAVTDAKNIYLIKSRRDGSYRNIFETKYFFISSDQGLRRWDFNKCDATPTVLLPSQWMSILLRYINRTNDDFKSFVSFLNLSQNESNITNEKLQLILMGISEITTDVKNQSSIVGTMVENRFQGILDKNYTDDEIIEYSKIFAQSQLEKDLLQSKKQNDMLEISLETHMEGAKAAISEVEKEQQRDREKTKELAFENYKLKTNLRKAYVKRKLFWWQLWGYLCFPLLLLILSLYILLFCCSEWEGNIPHQIALRINAMPDTMEREIAKTLYGLPAAGILGVLLFMKNRVFINSKIQAKKQLLEDVDPSKYIF